MEEADTHSVKNEKMGGRRLPSLAPISARVWQPARGRAGMARPLWGLCDDVIGLRLSQWTVVPGKPKVKRVAAGV